MRRILQLTFLSNLLLVFVIAGIEESGIYKASNVTKVHYLASKYSPHFVPCKYGAELAFDQAHFVSQVNGNISRTCPSGCESMTVPLPGTNNLATVCCLPETPWKHLKTVSVSGGLGPIDSDTIADKLKVTHWLSLAFPDVVPKSKKRSARNADIHGETSGDDRRVTVASIGYMALGAAVAQSLVFGVACFTFYVTNGRMELDAPPDCDYTIQPEVKVYNPSKSAMLSDNMNSDLMSMSQGAM